MGYVMPERISVTQPVERETERNWVGRHRAWLAQATGYLGIALCVLFVGIPVYWMIIGAFKELDEIYRIPPTWLPLRPTLSNFAEAWQAAPFGRYYINTIITTLWGSGLELFFAIATAYAFAFLYFPQKDRLFLFLLAALMIPGQITILPNFLTVGKLGWINTYAGIVMPGASIAYGTFLLRQYYLTLPRDILDAARVDGAGHLRILWSVVMPLAKPSARLQSMWVHPMAENVGAACGRLSTAILEQNAVYSITLWFLSVGAALRRRPAWGNRRSEA